MGLDTPELGRDVANYISYVNCIKNHFLNTSLPYVFLFRRKYVNNWTNELVDLYLSNTIYIFALHSSNFLFRIEPFENIFYRLFPKYEIFMIKLQRLFSLGGNLTNMTGDDIGNSLILSEIV